MLQGQMMNVPLTITSIMEYADRVYSDSEIVSVAPETPRHRYTFAEAFCRTRQLANALRAVGVKPGDRVATLAWNDYRHFELFYAISCSGAVCHTVNPKLFAEQIKYIINHAEDEIVFADPDFVPILEEIIAELATVRRVVILTDVENMPATTLPAAVDYETFISGHSDLFEWPELQEDTASGLCYTSGTTGNPKGVLYSHRSTVLHSFATVMPDALCLSSREAVMPVVPMYHVNAWGLPFSCAMVGAKLVLPGAKMGSAETLQALIEDEGVTLAAGVPTIWSNLLRYLRDTDKTLHRLERALVGGSACPLSIISEFREDHDVQVIQGWGMTETGPIGTLNVPAPWMKDLSQDQADAVLVKQGRPIFGVDLRVVDEDERDLPWDGEASGEVRLRGNWVSSGYFRADDAESHDPNGYLKTGDVACVDQLGFMQITDRVKDMIKSGGEWISSIDLENAAASHPAIAEAAVIGIPHPKWNERPLLVAVAENGAELCKQDVLSFLDGKIAKWWMPDDVVFVDEIPHTATGKISKKDLRLQFSERM